MPETSPKTIRIEVIYADARTQIVRSAVVTADATVEEALHVSAIGDLLPAEFVPVSVGIFGRVVAMDARLQDGDRIELYRRLKIDPKQARRRRAQRQKED